MNYPRFRNGGLRTGSEEREAVEADRGQVESEAADSTWGRDHITAGAATLVRSGWSS